MKEILKKNRYIVSLYENLVKTRARVMLRIFGLKYLERIMHILYREKILSFVDFGSLLGIIREGDLLKHDLDIDIGIINATFDTQQKICEIFKSQGFKKSREFTVRSSITEQSYIKHYVKIDIQYYFYDNDNIYCYLFYDPSIASNRTRWKSVIKKCPEISSCKSVVIRNKVIFVPENAEEILEFKYGNNWRTPDKGWKYWEGPNTYPSSETGLLTRYDQSGNSSSYGG